MPTLFSKLHLAITLGSINLYIYIYTHHVNETKEEEKKIPWWMKITGNKYRLMLTSNNPWRVSGRQKHESTSSNKKVEELDLPGLAGYQISTKYSLKDEVFSTGKMISFDCYWIYIH